MQKFGFLFPGQGSQKLGMLSQLAGQDLHLLARGVEIDFASLGPGFGMAST